MSTGVSLRTRILKWLTMLFVALLVIGVAVSYVAAVDFANLPYDRELLEIARAFGRQAVLRADAPELGVPDEFKRTLLRDDIDRMYYKVTGIEGRLAAGDAALPTPPPTELSSAPQFENLTLRGETLRLCTLTIELDSQPGSRYVVVQVAETVFKRRQLTRQIFVTMIVPQVLLTILASFGLWLGLGSGLAPLERVREAVLSRTPRDLSPLEYGDDTPDELRPLIEAFNEVLARMSKLLDSQQRFVADAAHQLRTPLAGVKTQAELALRLDDREAVATTLRQVLAGAERGSALISQLLALARHEEGGQDLQIATIDLNDVARAATTKHVSFAIEKGIDLGFEPVPAPARVAGNALGAEEMVANLVDNAVRYTPAGGHVTVRVATEADAPAIVVEDDGPGVPPEDRERIFERFYRRLGTDQTGSGLGLSIVAEIARLHGAEVTVRNGAGGRGAAFVIRFGGVRRARAR